MSEVVFPGNVFDLLRSELLLAAPNEAAAVLFAGMAGSSDSTRLLIREVHVVPHGEYLQQEPDYLALSPVFLAGRFKHARTDGLSVLLAHTHPFSKEPQFSRVDDAGEAKLLPAIQGRVPGRPHGALVIGQSGVQARWYPAGEMAAQFFSRMRCVGPTIAAHPDFLAAPGDDERDDRSIRAFGRVGRDRLHQVTVAIVGLGGTGSWIAQELAHLGVSRLILVDDDVVDRSNLSRLIGARAADLGRDKVAVAADGIRRINESASVQPIRASVLHSAVGPSLKSADFVFCCTDSQGSRALLNQFAYQYFVPTIDLGVRIDAAGPTTTVTGRVQMLAPGLACLTCSNLLDPEAVRRDFLSEEERGRDQYIVGAPRHPQPAVVSINGTMASLAVTMFLGTLTGLPSNARHLIYRLPSGMIKPVTVAPTQNCVVCSPAGCYGRGDDWPMPWRT